jgi:hypothetical protein
MLIFDQKERVGDWVAQQVEQTASWGSFYAMGVEKDGQIVAGVVVNNYNCANATAHIAIAYRTREIVDLFRHVCRYAFVQCGLSRLTGMVPLSKPDVIAFDKHLGFKEEFVMRKAAHDGGDLMVLVMWPDGCRWLGDK